MRRPTACLRRRHCRHCRPRRSTAGAHRHSPPLLCLQDLGKPAEAAITAAIERTFLDKASLGGRRALQLAGAGLVGRSVAFLLVMPAACSPPRRL